MSRVIVSLSQEEREALVKLALTDLRSPRDQARFIIIAELQRLGLIPKITLGQGEKLVQSSVFSENK
jgi:hypothetical protein